MNRSIIESTRKPHAARSRHQKGITIYGVTESTKVTKFGDSEGNIGHLGNTLENLNPVLKNLNPPQLEAVNTLEGPLLILAGAGSGKTRVLTHRVANLIAQGKASPEEVLCVTFTNKAAREMEHRIHSLLSQMGVPVRSELWISTFHSTCVRILRQHVDLIDFKPFFAIYDAADSLSQIKKVLNALNIDDKVNPAKGFQARMSNVKMLGLFPEDVAKSPARYGMDTKSLEVYRLYQEEMKKANAMDFDDLLLRTWDLYRMYPDVLAAYQQKFRYIMVDEYQDTNHIQYLLIKALAEAHRNICVVGDEDQSIYSWRGADIRNILDFEKDFSETKVVMLEENYRSTANIVKAATAVIQNNTKRKNKKLFTSNPAGDKIQVREERSEYDEARFVARTVESLMSSGEAELNDFAVFYRTNAQSRVLEEQFRLAGIPYRLVGGLRFYERMEIKDLIAYLRLSVNPLDDMAFKRVINVPTRGIGKTTVERLEEISVQKKIPLAAAAELAINERQFNAGTAGKIRRFLELLSDLQNAARHMGLLDLYHVILDKTEYISRLKAEGTSEAESRIANLEELDNAIEQFIKERGDEASVQSFLEEIALVSDADSMSDAVNAVTLMALHISKGLEFPYVFIVGMEEHLFPSAAGGFEENLDDLEEERRLCYVGMTRARRKLWLTYAKTRRVWGQEESHPPSRFINEIPRDLIQFSSAVAFESGFLARHARPGQRTLARPADDHHSFPDEDFDQRSQTNNQFTKGAKVKHPTFGTGTIYATEGSGEMMKVSVIFADQSIRKFVLKHARLTRV